MIWLKSLKHLNFFTLNQNANPSFELLNEDQLQSNDKGNLAVCQTIIRADVSLNINFPLAAYQ